MSLGLRFSFRAVYTLPLSSGVTTGSGIPGGLQDPGVEDEKKGLPFWGTWVSEGRVRWFFPRSASGSVSKKMSLQG